MLNSMKYTQEFKDILKNIESKYQINHERIGALLKEQGVLIAMWVFVYFRFKTFINKIKNTHYEHFSKITHRRYFKFAK